MDRSKYLLLKSSLDTVSLLQSQIKDKFILQFASTECGQLRTGTDWRVLELAAECLVCHRRRNGHMRTQIGHITH